MTIILSSCGIAPPSCTVPTDQFSEIPVVVPAAARVTGRFSLLSAVPLVGVDCLDAVQLLRIALVR
jgi:hypothetical protein